jgi:hypothetical protein
MLSLTMTEKKNTTLSPEIGDYVIKPQCHCGYNPRIEGYIIGVKWIDGINHIELFNPLTQEYNSIKHTMFIDSDAPEGAINHFM